MTRRVLGVGALLIAALLAIVGTFLPLYRQSWDFVDSTLVIEQTSWAMSSEEDVDLIRRDTLYGLPLVVGALLMVLGAFRLHALWGRLTAFGGSVLLFGSTWALAQYVYATYAVKQPSGIVVTMELGLGLVLLVVASVLAVTGGLLVQEWPPRAPRPEGPLVYQVDGNDDDTPPFGIPVAELPGSAFGAVDARPDGEAGRTGP